MIYYIYYQHLLDQESLRNHLQDYISIIKFQMIPIMLLQIINDNRIMKIKIRELNILLEEMHYKLILDYI